MQVELERVGLQCGEFRLLGLSLSLPSGQCGVLMGPTGEGKTSLLEAVCGLRRLVEGTVRLGGRDLAGVAPGGRGIGLVPQDVVLFPHLTVYEHLAFAPRLRGEEKSVVDRRCRDLAEALGIEQLVERRPRGLSGGEAKRVALGRALAAQPVLLCLDEPFAGLDEATRAVVESVIAEYRQRSGATMLLVTHDEGESERLGDLAWELCDGRLQARAAEPSSPEGGGGQ